MMTTSRDLMTRLKEDTRQLHDQAEAAGYMHHLMAGTLSRERFIASIEQTYLLHSGLEPLLRNLRQTSPLAASALKDYHFVIAEGARRDLEFFGRSTHGLRPNEGVRAFLAEAHAWDARNPEALLGMFYVLEGSLNGAKIIGKKCRDLFQLEEGQGLQHLDPHGRDMRSRWMEFVTTMNTLPFTEQTKADMVEAAGQAFRYVGQMYREICREVA